MRPNSSGIPTIRAQLRRGPARGTQASPCRGRALRKEAEELEAYLAEKVLREADVVCATLVGCDDRRLRGVKFDVAVVDEAAQALPRRR